MNKAMVNVGMPGLSGWHRSVFQMFPANPARTAFGHSAGVGKICAEIMEVGMGEKKVKNGESVKLAWKGPEQASPLPMEVSDEACDNRQAAARKKIPGETPGG